MNKFYILCGYPFAGKSTVAKLLEKKFGFTRIDMKKYFSNGEDVDWDKTHNIYASKIKQNLKQKKTIIVDTVGYNRKGRDDLKKLAIKYGAEPVIIYMNAPLSVVKGRWLKNKQTNERHDVTDEEFNNIVNNFEIPTKEENLIVINPEMNKEQIFDLFQ